VGVLDLSPAIPTAAPGDVRLILDQRHGDADGLAAMLGDARRSAAAIASDEGVALTWAPVQSVRPVEFDAQLVAVAGVGVRETAGETMCLPSGALHDAVMVARAGVPSVMVFVRSLDGISHNRLEDSRREHISLGVTALGRLVRRLIDQLRSP
jgi:N-carbamoyl-L-amino-acid hydrolase